MTLVAEEAGMKGLANGEMRSQAEIGAIQDY